MDDTTHKGGVLPREGGSSFSLGAGLAAELGRPPRHEAASRAALPLLAAAIRARGAFLPPAGALDLRELVEDVGHAAVLERLWGGLVDLELLDARRAGARLRRP